VTDYTIEHDAARGRFQTEVDGQSCVCEYRLADGVMLMTHTEVPPELEGRSIAASLVRAALLHAQAEGLKVRPYCSYVRVYLRRHPEFGALVG
jgi:predicted GNAT family acetyltransferase